MQEGYETNTTRKIARKRWSTDRIYKVLWYDISSLFVNAINTPQYQKGLLSVAQRRGIISVIPQRDYKENILYYLKNRRPISLINSVRLQKSITSDS